MTAAWAVLKSPQNDFMPYDFVLGSFKILLSLSSMKLWWIEIQLNIQLFSKKFKINKINLSSPKPVFWHRITTSSDQ